MYIVPTVQSVKLTYYSLMSLSTLAASFIWGINTLFLLSAGLSNTEAFAANAFFTLGQVLFEVPTGVVADTRGRRFSYALGVVTLLITTLIYYWLWRISGPFWAWAIVSAFLGLGFTFFSGATEAWLVDALHFTGFKDGLESVFAKGQIFGGVAMLAGSIGGGLIAQYTNLGVPYILRAIVLGLTLVVCLFMMRDWGFSPKKAESPIKHAREVFKAAIDNGWRRRPVKFMILSMPFTIGVSFYVFYAVQPYLLELYGDPNAYGIAGLAAAITAASQIAGGFLVPYVRKFFATRSSILIAETALGVGALVLLGLIQNFWTAILLLVVWGLVFAVMQPIQQAYLNPLIESSQRATVLSFASLMGSSGGVVTQPILGRVADINGYPASYLVSAAFQAGSLPFLFLAKKERSVSDTIA